MTVSGNNFRTYISIPVQLNQYNKWQTNRYFRKSRCTWCNEKVVWFIAEIIFILGGINYKSSKIQKAQLNAHFKQMHILHNNVQANRNQINIVHLIPSPGTRDQVSSQAKHLPVSNSCDHDYRVIMITTVRCTLLTSDCRRFIIENNYNEWWCSMMKLTHIKCYDQEFKMLTSLVKVFMTMKMTLYLQR